MSPDRTTTERKVRRMVLAVFWTLSIGTIGVATFWVGRGAIESESSGGSAAGGAATPVRCQNALRQLLASLEAHREATLHGATEGASRAVEVYRARARAWSSRWREAAGTCAADGAGDALAQGYRDLGRLRYVYEASIVREADEPARIRTALRALIDSLPTPHSRP